MIRLKIFLTLSCLVTLAACSKEDVGPPAHKEAVSLAQPSVTVSGSISLLATDPKLATVRSAYANRFALAQEIDSSTTEASRLIEIAGSLAEAVLNATIVRNPRNQESEELVTALGHMNHAIMNANRRSPAELRASGILNQYEAFIFQNCPDSLRNCRNLPFLAGDSATSSVLLLVADGAEADVDRLRSTRGSEYFEASRRLLKLYRTIYTSLSSASLNGNFFSRYVKYSSDLESYMRSLSATERRVRSQDLRQHADFLNTSLVFLRSAPENQSARETYCRFVIDAKPFKLSLANTRDGSSQSVRQLANEFIRCATQNGSLSQIITEHLNEERQADSHARLDDPTVIRDNSYYYALNYLNQTPQIFANLSITKDERNDLAFYVIDRLFYEAIDQRLAINYWRHIGNISDLELLGFVENYIKVQMAYVLKATHAIVAKTIREEYQERGLSSDIFNRIVDRVNQKTQFEWETLKTRIRALREFLTPIFDERLARATLATRNSPAVGVYNGLKDRLDSLGENLNYVATSPIMLVMSYYMAKTPGQIQIFISWWRGTNQIFNIDGSESLAKFFELNRNWIRFFNYGTTDFTFDEFQMKHVFDFALRTGIFDSIPFNIADEDKARMRIQGGDELNNEWLFFRQFIEQRLRRHLIGSANEVDELDRTLRNYEFVDRFNRFCENPLSAPMRLDLDRLSSNPMLSHDTLKAGLERIYKVSGSFNVMRNDRRQVEDLLKILERHFFAPGAENRLSPEKLAKRNEIMAAIQAEFERYYVSERKLFAKMLEADRFVVRVETNCLHRIHRGEIFRMNALYKKNVDFYKDVHAGVTLINLFATELKSEDLSLTEANLLPGLREEVLKRLGNWRNSDAVKALQTQISQDIMNRMERLARVSLSDTAWQRIHAMPGSTLAEQTLGSRFEAAINGYFMPQNVAPVFVATDRGTEEYGIHVDGLESFARSNILFRPKSELLRSGFRHGKRDTFLRLRRQLQTMQVDAREAASFIGIEAPASQTIPIAPNLEVPIGTFAELAANSLFTSNDLPTVNYVADQTRFVQDAMSHFAGDNRGGNQFVSWHSSSDTYGLTHLRARFDFLKAIHENGTIEISDSNKRECQRDDWMSVIPNSGERCTTWTVSARTLLDSHMQILNEYRINNEERSIIEWIGVPGRFQSRASSLLRYRTDNTADWTYFDQFYRLNFTGQIGQRTDGTPIMLDRIEGKNEFDVFRDSFKLRIRPERQFYPMHDYVSQLDRNRVRRPLIQQLERVRNIEAIIASVEDAKVDLGPFIFERARNVRTDNSYLDNDYRFVQANTRTNGPRAGTPIYLRDDAESAQAWFRNTLQDFVVRETNCEILPSPGDPDYTRSTEAPASNDVDVCRNRFLGWQRALDALKANASSRN